ncbi:LacI family DNA-binding transcriptional regulator [Pontibacter sp. G13]|uniref:LacI family DNA-binding transcriptional regulator n=1 Tax=Pontibacter sp. G13 TaxID=3074898 RepID=UPI00288BD618|nr:LacI family DNA-binding transcriptional regulator [Pontibacter sp. G13]WNJ19659.1 LacI family DNA-binding transcriptional regulator [Pontibacter sp. G13]
MAKRQTTLADLARELGISAATVSRALKDYPDISAKTKERVMALAKERNYRPNSMAAGLRKRESRVIGVIVPSIVNHFFASVIRGIMREAYESDYRVMICQSDESQDKECTDTRALFDRRVDGLMVSLAHETEDLAHFQEVLDAGVPIVFFDKVPTRLNEVSKVEVDDFGGAFAVTQHLIDQGYRRISHLTGPKTASTAQNRLLGYRRALEANGIPYEPSRVFSSETFDFDSGKQMAKQALTQSGGCDAIFGMTDLLAMSALAAAQDLGLEVPKDLGVAGFSNWEMGARWTPAITSVDQPSEEMGRKATELLLKEIQANKLDEPFDPVRVQLETQLVIRKSSRRNDRS